MRITALPHLEGFLMISLLLLITACGTEPTPVSEQAEPEKAVTTVPDLRVAVATGRMRNAPNPQAAIIQELPRGASLQDLGGVSDKTTQITYGSEKFDEPWLEVQDSTGQEGWIYAREVIPARQGIDLQKFRREKQLLSMFGRQAVQDLTAYRNAWQAARTDAEVAAVYHQGNNLRDTLAPFLEEKSYSYDNGPLPNLFWLDEFVPAYVTQLVAEGTVYYLFNDYDQWLQLARKSDGPQDDQFFDLMIRCFPQDSVEYFYPAWMLQTWDYGGHHLLGRGLTYDILADIEQLAPRTPLFSKPLLQLKDQILADLTQPNIHFWEPDSLVKREMDAIIQANWSIFTATDRIALDTRRMQLDSAAYHGIGFNARAGE